MSALATVLPTRRSDLVVRPEDHVRGDDDGPDGRVVAKVLADLVGQRHRLLAEYVGWVAAHPHRHSPEKASGTPLMDWISTPP